MAANTFGELFRLSSFGESHGKGVGGVIDGIPPGWEPDLDAIQEELNRRKPGQSHLASPRQEKDKLEIFSGLFDGKVTGTPLAFMVWNEDQKSADYNHIKEVYRPSHADYTYQQKYGIRDHRGGGRSSARETIARVVAGSIARQYLQMQGIQVTGYVSAIGEVSLPEDYFMPTPSRDRIEASLVRCPDEVFGARMQSLIEQTKTLGDTLGGVISCHINGLPVGLGAPVFDKFHADLGKAMLSINAVKGFEYGTGFKGATRKGSEENDQFLAEGGKIRTRTNHSGGVQGGITNGEEVYFRVAFKPVATLMQTQSTVDAEGNMTMMEAKGRHDVCVVPRAVVIVESMAAMVCLDHFLRNNAYFR